MSRRTYCDRCDRECVNLTYAGHFSARHTTRRQEIVDETEPVAIDLCDACAVLVLGRSLVDKIRLRAEAEAAQRDAERRGMEAERPIPRDERPLDPPIPSWER